MQTPTPDAHANLESEPDLHQAGTPTPDAHANPNCTHKYCAYYSGAYSRLHLIRTSQIALMTALIQLAFGERFETDFAGHVEQIKHLQLALTTALGVHSSYPSLSLSLSPSRRSNPQCKLAPDDALTHNASLVPCLLCLP